MLGIAVLAVALFVLAFAASAQAVEYTPGAELITGAQTSSVTVDQSNGEVYVGSVVGPGSGGTTQLYTGEEGSVKRFDSAGTEQSCALSPAPSHPDGLAVDPSSGTLYALNIMQTAAAAEVRAYPTGCGSERPATTGTADTETGSKELKNVSGLTHPLLVGQGVEGPGIATALGTAELSGSILKNVNVSSGTLAVGQRVTGGGIWGNRTIKAIKSPTEIELSSLNPGYTAPTTTFIARTTITKVEGSTVELSNAAEATGTGVAISGMAWRTAVQQGTFPTPQPAVGSSSTLFIPSLQNSKLEKFTPWGEELQEGGLPVAAPSPSAVSFDAKGNIFLASGAFPCSNTAGGKLRKLNSKGEALPEGDPIGPESAFAGLTENVTSVTVDKTTGNVYVGRGCQATEGHEFKIEEYGPGGTKLTEFSLNSEGHGFGAGNINIANQLAVNESNGTVYAADPGNFSAKVFHDTSAPKALTTAVSGGMGEVLCNGTGVGCLAGYDEGQEVIAEAEAEEGLELKEWVGTGSATSCTGTTGPCTFTLDEDSQVEAVMQSSGPAHHTLNLHTSGSGSGTFTCKVEGGSEEPCEAEYEEGKSVEVVPQQGTGSEFVEFDAENGGECTGATCVFTMDAEHTANARFDLVAEPFSATKAGEGTVECEDLTALTGPGACASSYPYGHTVKVEAEEEEGWTFEGISGTGSATGCTTSGCEFQITESSSVHATFAEIENPSTLTVFKGGDGEGSVKSLAPNEGIECGAACEEASASFEEGETIELEETPAEGSTFAGWLGCRRVSGTNRCRVTLNGPEPEVTAVFLAAGKEGAEGPQGEKGEEGAKGEKGDTGNEGPQGEKGDTGPEGPQGDTGDTGPEGPKGDTGATGAPGSAGPAGATGPQGAQGAKGDTGSAGAQGPAGATGPQGPQGPAGKVTVTCKVKYQGKKKAKVTCTVKYPKGSSQARRLRWSLHRAGHVVSHGNTGADRLQRVLNHLRPGHYRLHVAGRSGEVAIRIGG